VNDKKVLFISGSIGLGHVTRDLAIARELCRNNPQTEISWLAAQPASLVLKQAGEKLLPEADQYADENIFAENAANGARLNILKYLLNARNGWTQNVEIFKQVVDKKQYDLVIADEAYEIVLAWGENPELSRIPFVMIYDFVGLDSMTHSPLEKLGIYMWNRIWSQGYQEANDPNLLEFFIGEFQDIPDRRFGFLLPNRRDFAKKKYECLGYVLGFSVEDYVDKARVRAELGYGSEPLVICSIGGTTIGKDLLELCGQAYPLVREKIPNLQMVLVCGPRLSADSLDVPHGVKIEGYVPDLFKHFAASDLAIVQGGGSTTLELTALRRPFLYFPLEEHFEQQICVAGRLNRHKAGVKMMYSQTTPVSLAEKIVDHLNKDVTYDPIPSDGAQKAVQLMGQFLSSKAMSQKVPVPAERLHG
jgi:UDP-N-acetylglucosamine:LPS N-acetylglucosamine transferase